MMSFYQIWNAFNITFMDEMRAHNFALDERCFNKVSKIKNVNI